MEDRRIFARIPVDYPARFLDLTENKEGDAVTCDISAKGIGLVVNKKLQPRSDLEMWLKLPDGGDPFYTRGQVVWLEELQPDKYKVGIKLERADLMGVSRVMRARR